MLRPRFIDFRTSDAAQDAGLCTADIPSLAILVNKAMRRLMIDPMQPDEGWWGTWARMLFNVTQANPYIVAPRSVARIIVMDVCNTPVKIQNGFYEFLDFSRGLQPSACTFNIAAPSGLLQSPCNQVLQTYERETVFTFSTLLPTPQQIQLFPSDSRDVGKMVIIQGKDANGLEILSTDAVTGSTVLGEQIRLNVPFVTTTNSFASITGIQKDLTFGAVTFFQVDPTTLVSNPLSTMEPSETAANYRKYFLNGLPANCCNTPGGIIQVTAMVKLEFVPVVSDPDYLCIPNVEALVSECQAVRYRRMDTKDGRMFAKEAHADALTLLFGQLDHYLGKERTAINVPIFGSDRLRAQPI